MFNVNPKGYIGETVGYNGGYTSSKTERAVIAGVTQTTVSIVRNGERITFNRSTWRKRGQGSSRFCPYLVNEATLLRCQTQEELQAAEKRERLAIRSRLEELVTALHYTKDSQGFASLAAAFDELSIRASKAADELVILEGINKVAREGVN